MSKGLYKNYVDTFLEILISFLPRTQLQIFLVKAPQNLPKGVHWLTLLPLGVYVWCVYGHKLIESCLHFLHICGHPNYINFHPQGHYVLSLNHLMLVPACGMNACHPLRLRIIMYYVLYCIMRMKSACFEGLHRMQKFGESFILLFLKL